MKIKIQKLVCTSTRHTLSYTRVSFLYYLKFRWRSSDKPYTKENIIYPPSYDPRGWNENAESLLHIYKTCPEKKKSRFSTLVWPFGIKWKFRNLSGHLQDMTKKSWWSLSDKITPENVIFRPLFDPRGQNENFKTLLGICKTHPMKS